MGLLHIGFFKQVEHQIMTRLHNKLNGQEMANLLWSFATLNAQPDPALVDTISNHVYRLCSGKNKSLDEISIASVFKRQGMLVMFFCLRDFLSYILLTDQLFFLFVSFIFSYNAISAVHLSQSLLMLLGHVLCWEDIPRKCWTRYIWACLVPSMILKS